MDNPDVTFEMESTVNGVSEIFKFRYKANKNENNVADEDGKKRIEFLEIMTMLLGGENEAEVNGEKNG